MRPIRILIVGAGFGGMYALKKLHTLFCGNRQIEVSLVGEKNYFLFTPLLHEVATGGLNSEDIVEPIRKILGCCRHDFFVGRAEHISLSNRTITVDGTLLPYDYLILAPGAQTNFYGIPDAQENTFTLKSLEDALRIKNQCINLMEAASHSTDREKRRQMLRFVVVGGGPTGVELAAELQELIHKTFSRYYPQHIVADASVVLVQRGSELLPPFSLLMRSKSLKVLRRKGVTVMLNIAVVRVGKSFLEFADKKQLAADTIIWVAGIRPNSLDFDVSIPRTAEGRLIVNAALQLEQHPEVFVVGDAATIQENGVIRPTPALAQVAVQEAAVVADNIKRLLEGLAAQSFKYKSAGNLVSLGQWMAIAEISGFAFGGHIAWWFWRTVYLTKLLSWRKKVKVAASWTINLFSARDIAVF